MRGHQQLQRLSLFATGDPDTPYAQELAELVTGMPALQHLALRYQYVDDAEHAAPTWKQLPLRDL
jgi:hypothetical protein